MPQRVYYTASPGALNDGGWLDFQGDDRAALFVVAEQKAIIVGTTVTRPADTTAYASGDLVANSTTAGSVTPISFTSVPRGSGKPIQIRRVRILTSSTSVTNASFRVHLFNGSGTITCANGDNGAFSTSGAANYLGQVDVTVGQAFTDGAAGQATTEINCSATTTTLYGLIECRGAYTPTSAGTFIVSIEVNRN